ncbi:MAG: hypothetical protein GWN33_14500 [Gammaproteobacteria bacterium]|nr:hypothetical protein [Gammaproteobacteria bacterium]
MSDALRPFHFAIPVDNIADARQFCTGILGCRLGRESAHWIDFNFFWSSGDCASNTGLS